MDGYDAQQQALSAKSRQIQFAHEKVGRLTSELGVCNQQLQELEHLMALCQETENQFIYTAPAVSRKFSAFAPLYETTKSASGYEACMSRVTPCLRWWVPEER